MKLYLNSLWIFLSIFAITSLAIAETPTTEVPKSKTTEELSNKSPEQEILEEAIYPEARQSVRAPVGTIAIADETENSDDTDIIESDESTEVKSTQEAINNTIFVQCSIQEIIVDTAANSENTASELATNSETTDQEAIETTSSSEKEPEDIIIETTTTEVDTEDTESEELAEEVKIEVVAEVTNNENCLTPEEVVRYHKLSIADDLFKAGDKLTAAQIYQEEKTPWDRELDPSKILPEAHHDPTKLSPGAAVYWRIYQEGKEQGLESKILTPLELLVAKEPQFIPGHINYAEVLLNYEREEESLAVLEQAISLFPKDTKLLRTKIAADVRTERWLDASISSRQFALFNPELPEAAEFTQLADEYLEEFKSDIRGQLTFNAIGNAITGAVGFALTGNIFGPISAIDTTILLLQGESKLGEKFAKRAQKQLPMVENEAILSYVREVGDKVAAVSGRDEFQYEFHVIMDERINAFALPGGKIFVNLGVMMNTDSEAELAGLLAHEAAHAVLSHGFQLATRGSLTANITQYIPYIGGTAGNLIVMNYSREMERQADLFGTRMLVASDYAADGVRNLMAQLQELNEEDEDHLEPPVWLSTHPHTEERVRYMEEFIVENNLNRYNYEGVERHYQMKQLAKQIWQEYEAEQEAKEEEDF